MTDAAGAVRDLRREDGSYVSVRRQQLLRHSKTAIPWRSATGERPAATSIDFQPDGNLWMVAAARRSTSTMAELRRLNNHHPDHQGWIHGSPGMTTAPSGPATAAAPCW